MKATIRKALSGLAILAVTAVGSAEGTESALAPHTLHRWEYVYDGGGGGICWFLPCGYYSQCCWYYTPK